MARLRLVDSSPGPPAVTPLERAVERYGRAVARFHNKTANVPDRALRAELGRIGDLLDSCLADQQSVRRQGIQAGREDVVLRAVQRAATLCAHASEAALMAAERARHREFEDVVRCVDTAWTLSKVVRELTDTCLLYVLHG
jgi:hypothetical protein